MLLEKSNLSTFTKIKQIRIPFANNIHYIHMSNVLSKCLNPSGDKAKPGFVSILIVSNGTFLNFSILREDVQQRVTGCII